MIRKTSLCRHLAVLSLMAGGNLFGQTLSPVAVGISRETASMGMLSTSRQEALNPTPATTSQTLPRVFAPTLPRATYTRYPWKTDIMTTVFWVGELPTENNPTPNTKSSWDTAWTANYGGYDDPDPNKRAPDYRPAAFVPKQNPFYVALPYNDCLDYRTTKPDAPRVIPWFKQTFERHGKSVCRDRWIAIRYQDRICYAQWSDCGPFLTDDVGYVFGDAKPANYKNGGAGLDVSPAVRDYLGFNTNHKVDWRFVDVHEVPDGPWKMYGTNNHFVQQAGKDKDLVAARLEELRRKRDEWFRQNGSKAMQLR
jgi:hypothetical protein